MLREIVEKSVAKKLVDSSVVVEFTYDGYQTVRDFDQGDFSEFKQAYKDYKSQASGDFDVEFANGDRKLFTKWLNKVK